MDQTESSRVVLYGRAGCHLCDVARTMVEQVCGSRAQRWREVDIAADDDLLARYGELIPVIEVDGRRIGFWRIEPAELSAALDGA